MYIGSGSVTTRGRPPGLYIVDREAAAVETSELLGGVPAFIGFANWRDGEFGRGLPPAVSFDRWDAQAFNHLIAPVPESYLCASVRGFFANGGKNCFVLAVRPPQEKNAGSTEYAKALTDILEPDGPLEDCPDIDLVCVPDALSPLARDGDATHEIHAATLAHCERMGNRFAILDAPEEAVSPHAESDGPEKKSDDPVSAMESMAGSLRSAFGALYFPWIAVDGVSDGIAAATAQRSSAEWRCLPSPSNGGAPRRTASIVPPCGHVAGLYARIDSRVGPQRAPANETLEDVLDTSVQLTAEQHARLNEAGVNCLVSGHDQGIQVAGARTLSGHSAMAYVSTARVIVGVRRWLAVGMRDLVFEPQTTMLWDRIRGRLISHCLNLQRAGALVSGEATQAFFVKCDEESNAFGSRDLGRVVAYVGLAPSVPAEFIILRVTHDAKGITVNLAM